MEFDQEDPARDPGQTVAYVAAGICHELNNLLLPIQSHLAALRTRSSADAGALQHVEALEEAVRLLRGLSENVHLFSRVPSERISLGGRTDLAEWWRRQEPLLARAIPQDIRVEASLDARLPPVRLGPSLVTQIVLNLLMNSVRATASGGTIQLSARPTDAGGWVAVTVADSGCGMSAELALQARIPFFTTKNPGIGKGLGLSLVERIVEAGGGSLRIHSSPGEGTAVSFTLPVAEVSGAERSAESEAELVWIDVSEERLASYLRSVLTSAGYRLLDAEPSATRPAGLIVTDGGSTGPDLLESLQLEGVEPRVLALVADGWAVRRAGVLIVDPGLGFAAIRAALNQILSARRSS